MGNDQQCVSEMKNMMELKIRQGYQEKIKIGDKNINNNIKIEDLVVELKNERQLKVTNITDDGRFECILPGGITPLAHFIETKSNYSIGTGINENNT